MKEKNCHTLVLIITVLPFYVASQNWKPIGTNTFVSVNKCPIKEIRIDTTDTNKYFDCDYYNYFKKTPLFPKISKKDSINAAKYLERARSLGVVYGSGPWRGFIPYVTGQRDTSLIHNLHKERKTFKFNSLTSDNIISILNNDACLIGKVIIKRAYPDTAKCKPIKNEMIIEVVDVIHSYFPLQKGNKVWCVENLFGGHDECEQPRDYRESVMPSHGYDPSVGETLLIRIDSYWYRQNMQRYENEKCENAPSGYKENYCSQVFWIDTFNNKPLNEKTNEKIKDLKLFFETQNKKR
jgi:hypothetical protein